MSSANITLGSTLLSIQRNVVQYVYSTYIILGVTGACLNILLFVQRSFRTVSCCTYFIAASTAMLVQLCVACGAALYALNYPDPTVNIVTFCKMRTYLSQSLAMIYRWCLTMACLDRYALSSASARLRSFARVRVTRRVVLLIVAVWIMLPIHTLILYNLRNGSCGIFDSIGGALYHSLFTTVMSSVLPVAIMATCAILIHRNLRLKRQRRRQNLNQAVATAVGRNEVHAAERKRDQQVLVMLILQAGVYVGLTTPLMVFYFYNAVSLYIPNKSAERLATERFAQFAAEVVILLFPTISFYLHTVVSRSFRHDFVKLIRSIATCNWRRGNQRVEPASLVTANRL